MIRLNPKENNEKNDTKNNNILANKHNLDYYDHLKNKQKMYTSINNNNNLCKLKENILNKNILTLENNEKSFKNSLYCDIKKKTNIPKKTQIFPKIMLVFEKIVLLIGIIFIKL